jgi:RHS repeat-associated protein
MIRECPFANNPQLVGDPVDTYSGAVVERQRDFRLAGPLPLEWFRVYNSQLCDQVFVLGRGQSHEFACRLKFDLDGIRFESALGKRVWFPPLLKDGQSASNNGKRLTRIGRLVYQLNEHAHCIREFVFSDPLQPAPIGRLIRGTHQIQIQHNKQGQLESITDSLDNEIFVEHDDQELLAMVYIPKTRFRDRRVLVRYDYDQRGNIEVVTDLYGNSLRFSYDAANRMVRRVDRNGHAFSYAYDNQGRCIHTTGSDGVLDNRLEYEIDEQCTKVTQSNGAVLRYRYELGKLVAIEGPLGGAQKFVYDDKGQLKHELDYQGNVTQSVYNEDGGLVGKIDPLGTYHAQPINLNESQTRNHRVARNAAEFEYGYLVTINTVAALEQTAEVASDEQSQIHANQVEDADQYSSHNFGFVIGRNWWPTPSSGRKFDIAGNLFQQANQQGNVRRWVYDANGNIAKFVDFDNGVWKYGYRSWNHLVEKVNPLGIATRMEYDSRENVTQFIDGGGTRSEYAYDLNDQLTEVRRHGQLRESYQRDSAGNLIAKFASDGRKLLDLEYGVGSLLTKRILSSGDEHTYSYDPNGRYMSAKTSNDSVEFKYDPAGNRCMEKRNGIGVEHVFRGWRKVEKCVWLDRFNVQYKVERDGVLVIVDPTGGKHRLEILKGGIVRRVFANGTSELAKYDELGRCLSKEIIRSGRRNWIRNYRWSGEGKLREVTDSQFGRTGYEYDAANRLISRTNSNGTLNRYEYDSANNLLSAPDLENVVIQNGNRIQYVNDERYEHNDRNNISAKIRLGEVVRYNYDSRDQLVECQSKDMNWSAEYDAIGRRTRKFANGRKTEYLWNSDQLAGEISPEGRLRLYIYADVLALTPLMFVDYDSVDADPSSGNCYFVFSDQIGTPITVEDEVGRVVWHASIEPLGKAKLSSENKIKFNFRFPGHYWDEDLKLNYNRFRYYDPVLGRYIQCDPLGVMGNANVYGYCVNPLLNVDVRGQNCKESPVLMANSEDNEDAEPVIKPHLADDDPHGVIADARAEEANTAAALKQCLNDQHPRIEQGVTMVAVTVQDRETGAVSVVVVSSTSRDATGGIGPLSADRAAAATGANLVEPSSPPVGDNPVVNRRNETVGTDHHAEQRAIEWAKENNHDIIGMTPTRPCCPGCTSAIQNNGDPGMQSVQPSPTLPPPVTTPQGA